jgi:hypothetical protein
MKNYTHITHEQDWTLLARYGTIDHTGDLQSTFDELQDYSVYPHETGAFIAEYTPTLYAFGSYATLEEALKAVLFKIKTKIETYRKIKEEQEKFDEVAKKNSLDERYRDKVVPTPKKKPNLYLQNLRNRTEELHAQIEKARMERNWKLQMEDYSEALTQH